jgi:hypothetical protein
MEAIIGCYAPKTSSALTYTNARESFYSVQLGKEMRRMATMNPARVFTAFDYDHDESLRNLLVGQSKHPDSPFEMHDWSVKDPFPGDWKARVRTKIRSVD